MKSSALFCLTALSIWSSAALAEPLTFGVPNKIEDLDPSSGISAQTKFTLSLVFEPLLVVDEQQELLPALAKSWQLDNANKKIRFVLNTNHRFSDGTVVTAKDVLASLKRLCQPKSAGATDLQGLKGCATAAGIEAKVLSEDQIELSSTINPAVFLFQFAQPRVVVSKLSGGRLVGSGPYRVSKKTDEALILERNPSFHAPAEVKNDGLVIKYINEQNFLGRFQGPDAPDGTIMYRASAAGREAPQGYRMINDPPYITSLLMFNNQRFPLNRPIVRQALAAALFNEHKIHTCATNVLPAYGVIPPGIGGSIAHMAPKELDAISPAQVFAAVPELAKKPVAVTLDRHADRRNDCEADQIVALAKRFNLNLSFRYHPDYKTLGKIWATHDYSGFLELYTIKNRDAHSIFQFFNSKNPENDANSNDRKLDALIQQSLEAPTVNARYSRYRDVNEYIQRNAMAIPLHYVGSSNFVSNHVCGVDEKFYFNPFQSLRKLFRGANCKDAQN